jgi:hypothetical protein
MAGGIIEFKQGGYRYTKGGFAFSSGVAAQPGFEIERARFLRPLPLTQGYAAIEAQLKKLGRPTTALAAVELRSAEPFTEEGFVAFNRKYVEVLAGWGIYSEGVNPVARTNVCPAYAKPAEPSLYAFSYTVAGAATARRTFVVAGGAERRSATPSEITVRSGESSGEAMRDKVRFVFSTMEQRLKELGFGWDDADAVRAYTVRDIGALVGPEIAAKSGGEGVTWILATPPVVGLEFEMDVRTVAREVLL